MKPYVIVTPARNEAEHMERLIRTVAAQTKPPERWVIVSDGSTDGTDEIVERYGAIHPFITLLHRPSSAEKRNFGSKVRAFESGLREVSNIPFEFLGNLDADISLVPNYYETLIQKFNENPRLGIAGGRIYDMIKGMPKETLASRDSVGGMAQFFRRPCYESTGGYPPLPHGGEDAVIEIIARMKGWEVQFFDDVRLFHHREMGSRMWRFGSSKFIQGRMYRTLGYHPLFFLMKTVYRVGEKPWIIGSVFLFCGYLYASFIGENGALNQEAATFLRQEQVEKMKGIFRRFRFVE